MASIIQIAPSGSLKQGQVVFAFQFEAGSIWQYALCKINNRLVLFGKHSSGTTFSPISNALLQSSGWLTDTTTKDYLTPLSGYALPATDTVGMAYATDNAVEVGLYSDGTGKVSTAPVTAQSTTDVIKSILTGSTDTTTTSTTDTTVTPWYKKPLFWVLTAVGAIGTIWYLKSK